MAKIIVIDDNIELVFLVKKILKIAGHEIIGVHSGGDALKELSNSDYDLALLDIMMPDLDGWQTLRLIRETDGLRNLPVAMLTAKMLTSEIALRKEVDELVDYIQKPFKSASLIEKVKSILKNLEELSKKRVKLRTINASEEIVDEYMYLVRAEKLHERLLRTLQDNLDNFSSPDRAKALKRTIFVQKAKVKKIQEQKANLSCELNRF